jgi:quercetin dioxygenase-like cupin family protein
MAHQRRPPFTKRLLILAAALGLLAAVLPLNVATAQAPAAVSLLKVSFPGVAVPASTFDLVQSVVDFEAGAASSASTTTAQSFLSVFEGELTIEVDGTPEVVAAGSGIAVPAGASVTMTNPNAGAKARLFVSTLAAVAGVDRLHDPSGAGIAVFGTVRRTMVNAPPPSMSSRWARATTLATGRPTTS